MRLFTTSVMCVVALGYAVGLAGPACAQVLGARPGYANALMKREHERQKFQADLNALRKQQAAETKAVTNANK